MKIFWSPLAMDRLEDIFEYISNKHNVAAQMQITKIFKRVETLTKYPERGRKVPEANREEIREVFEGQYRIIYRFDTKKVFVLTIRNFKQLLPEEDLK
jgi:toxin ParE1/3/4